jgi:hypothetical protein
VRLARPSIILSLVIAVAACGLGFGRSGQSTETAAPSAGPGHAETRHGDFVVTFDMPQTTWRTDETITGEAQLRFAGTGTAIITAGGGGPFGFELSEVGGNRRVAPDWIVDCVTYEVPVDSPITSNLGKSGSGDTAFAKEFMADKLYRLPPGDWTITAIAWFGESHCDGLPVKVRAAISVHVTP